jgi:hypothetical protein
METGRPTPISKEEAPAPSPTSVESASYIYTYLNQSWIVSHMCPCGLSDLFPYNKKEFFTFYVYTTIQIFSYLRHPTISLMISYKAKVNKIRLFIIPSIILLLIMSCFLSSNYYNKFTVFKRLTPCNMSVVLIFRKQHRYLIELLTELVQSQQHVFQRVRD